MSKFFATGDSDSESEVVSSDEEVQVDAGNTGNRFVYSSSESEDEGKRVVRSEKDKRFDELRATMRQIKNHLKINDWTAVQKDFDQLTKQLEKAEKVLKKEGLPIFLLSTMVQTEKAQKEQFENKSLYKKMAAPNAKALNTMKQKIKKFISQYSVEFEKYMKNPVEEEEEIEEKVEKEKGKKKKGSKKLKKKVESEDEEEDGDEDEDDDEEESEDEDRRVKFVKKPAKKKAAESEDEDDDEDDEESGDESDGDKKKKKKNVGGKKKASSDEESEEEESESSESSDSDADLDLASGKSAMFTRDFWVKKDKESSSESEEEEEREERRRKKREEKKRKEEAKEQASVEQALRAGQEKSGGQEMNPEQVIKKLKELLAMRGKRGTDRLAMISDLKLLASKATEPAAQLKVHTTLASALFDVTLNKGTHMPTQLWQECAAEVNSIINLLNANPNVRLSEDERVEEQFEEDAKDSENPVEEEKRKVTVEQEQLEQNEDLTLQTDQVQYVMGNLYSFVQLLCIEFRRSLQAIDFHTEEYITRLRDETLLSELVGKAQDYYKKVGKTSSEANVAFLRLELIYYKYTAEQDVLLKKISEEKKEEEKTVAAATPESLVSQLATFLYKHGNDQSRVRALLMHVFHLAIHNNWSVAREMLLMSHVHEAVNQTDIKTQVLFNRAMAQLGLSAFRNGEFRHCLDALAELVQSNHMLELLAQGISNPTQRWLDRDLEKEAVEKRRLYPFHMHLNKDFIEAAHLISAMLSEVPNLAVHGRGNRQKIISKVFRRLFEFHMKQAFTGPPENTRDLIMAATRSLRVGDWEKCQEHLNRLRFWRLMPQQVAAHVQAALKLKVQEEGLRTYLLTFSSSFTSLSLPQLAAQFSLSDSLVYRLTSKLMVNDQLAGAWDQPTQTIQLHSQNPTKLQKASLAFADKASLFVEQNERLLDSRQGFSQGFYKGSAGAAVERREKGQEEKSQRNDREGGWVEGGRSRGGRGGRGKPRTGRGGGGARPNNRR